MSKTRISRRRFLGQTVTAAAAFGLSHLAGSALAHQGPGSESDDSPQSKNGRPPNILFILADDLGWADLSVYGRSDFATPNLDRFAEQGVRLTQAYSNSSVCTPTRIALFTGRYPQRLPVGLQEPLPYRRQLEQNGQLTLLGLPPEHPTIASLLRDGGYQTALIGKWHAGYLPTFSPLKSGFNEFFGIFSGGVDYFTHKDNNGEGDLWEDETPVEATGYITDLITERAVEFLQKAARLRQPFYLSVHYTAPHWPWEGPGDEETSRRLKNLFHLDGGSPQIYAEIVRSLDSGVGKLLRQLERSGLAENTLVVFTSDNGGERFSDVWPFIGSKGGVYAGSHRVPALVRWPGRLPSNRVSQQVAITFDWTATLLAAAGVASDPRYPLDGIDLQPFLATAGAKEKTRPRTLYWRIGGQHAVRDGDLKYIKLARLDQVVTLGGLPAALRGTEFLFDLSKDVHEQANLKDERPDDLARLRQAWETWNATVLPETSPA
jgi:arylsulfatase A-like enzyme